MNNDDFSLRNFHAELSARNRIKIYRTVLEIVMRQTKCPGSSLIDPASLEKLVFVDKKAIDGAAH